jgi:2-dehydropantoate 2-reductase
MNIGVIGVGGVGGYFGGKLAYYLEQSASEAAIYFVARSKHLEEISHHGLILSTFSEGEMVCRPTLATEQISKLPLLDVCFICVKGYDLHNALKQIKPKITDETMIIALLNGVDIYDRIRAVIQNGIVFPACVYIGTHIESPGNVVQHGGNCTILLGPDPQNPTHYPEELLALFTSANIKFSWTNNSSEEIWSKYLFIASLALVSASENKTFGQIREDQKLRLTMQRIMAEVVAIAEKKGVHLPETIVEDSLQKLMNFPYETKTSFQRDFEQSDKPDERELFGDTIVRMGEELGVPTPTAKHVNEQLNICNQKAERKT